MTDKKAPVHGIMRTFKDSGYGTYSEVVAVVNLDGSPISGTTSSQSTVDFVDELYTVIKAWTGATLGSTVTYRTRTDKTTGVSSAFWVNASDVVIVDPPSPIGEYVESAFPSKDIHVLAVVDSVGKLWRQFTNTATGGLSYYEFSADVKGIPTGLVRPAGNTVIASDGVHLPIDSMEVAYSGAAGVHGTWAQTVVFGGNTYKKSIVFDTNGNITSQSGWVKQ
jgi:hypothetical protein